MARKSEPEERGTGELLEDIARHAGQLLAQQLDLTRAELAQELRKAGSAGAALAGGGGLSVAGGLLSGFAAAHLLRELTGLPLWLCYAAAAGGLGAAGAALLIAGRNGLANLRPLPETVAEIGENVQWLREQLVPAAG